MKTGTYISSEAIREAGNQKAMIFFFFLKSKYRTSVFYGYTPEKLANLTGLSVNTVRKYVGWLKFQGYARILPASDRTKRNLWLIATRKINPGNRLILIDTRPWTTWRQFENRVYAAIIRDNINKQAFHFVMKGIACGKLKKNISVRAFRTYSKKYGKVTKETQTMQPISSIRQIARLFNRSTGWSSQMLKRLVDMGYINTKQRIEQISEGYIPPEYYEGGGYVYYNARRNSMMLHRGTLITINY